MTRRVKKRYGNAHLNRRQVANAHTLYQAGWSTTQLADALWRKHGYANQASCRLALYKAFLRDGLPVRSRREALQLAYQARPDYKACQAEQCRRMSDVRLGRTA